MYPQSLVCFTCLAEIFFLKVTTNGHETPEPSVPPNKLSSTAPVVSFTALLVDETALATPSSVV